MSVTRKQIVTKTATTGRQPRRLDRGQSPRRPVSRERLTRRSIVETLTQNDWQLAEVNFHFHLLGGGGGGGE